MRSIQASLVGALLAASSTIWAQRPIDLPSEYGDFIKGTEGADEIDLLGGDDQGFGLGGNDMIDGGDGNDVIDGVGGDDIVRGGNGDDRLWGAEGNDVLEGGSGGDVLYGGFGDDRLLGGDGDDALYAGPGGRDTLEGGPGFDRYVFPDPSADLGLITIIDDGDNILKFDGASSSRAADVTLEWSRGDLLITYKKHHSVGQETRGRVRVVGASMTSGITQFKFPDDVWTIDEVFAGEKRGG